jgi:hypothetical protein
MADKLLTPTQAADYLCVHTSTLHNWRREGKGPKYHKLTESDRLDNSEQKSLIRYSIVHLDEFIESKTIYPKTDPLPPLGTIRHLTDNEWASVCLTVKSTNGKILTNKHRNLINDTLDACTRGTWKSGLSMNAINNALYLGSWLLNAFDALTLFHDFPFTLSMRYTIVRDPEDVHTPEKQLHAKTETYGPYSKSKLVKNQTSYLRARKLTRNRGYRGRPVERYGPVYIRPSQPRSTDPDRPTEPDR